MKFAPYEIQFQAAPNVRTPAGAAKGALILNNDGVGCLQPWPSLGDEPLEVHLEALRAGSSTALGRACLLCCEVDGRGRRDGLSLFEGLAVPPSHVLLQTGSQEEVAAAKKAGVAKAKGDAGFELPPGVRLRLDFNGSLDGDSFLRWADQLASEQREQIEFIEDPTPYDAELWERLANESGLDLALDRGPADATSGFRVRVWKPACVAEPPAGELYCITHNMDHQIGRLYAAYRAATFDGDLVECGLGDVGDLAGVGLGCNSLLERISWRPL